MKTITTQVEKYIESITSIITLSNGTVHHITVEPTMHSGTKKVLERRH